jgi:hypothetical protein
MHTDSAHFGNSSLAAEKVDVLLKGADAGGREPTSIDPELTEQRPGHRRRRRPIASRATVLSPTADCARDYCFRVRGRRVSLVGCPGRCRLIGSERGGPRMTTTPLGRGLPSVIPARARTDCTSADRLLARRSRRLSWAGRGALRSRKRRPALAVVRVRGCATTSCRARMRARVGALAIGRAVPIGWLNSDDVAGRIAVHRRSQPSGGIHAVLASVPVVPVKGWRRSFRHRRRGTAVGGPGMAGGAAARPRGKETEMRGVIGAAWLVLAMIAASAGSAQGGDDLLHGDGRRGARRKQRRRVL